MIAPAPIAARERRRIAVRGAVQGVGFRPFAARLAAEEGLAGWVRNAWSGAELEIEGSPARLARFVARLREELPPPGRLDALDEAGCPPRGGHGFAILESSVAESSVARTAGAALALPDLAPCAACLAEVRDPAARRYRYPFTSCTACGPRFSILEAPPWDRARTTLARFTPCAACRREYDDPADRRCHAQTLACPACGPRLRLAARDGQTLADGDEALRRAAQAIQQGRIVALKGLGGYQLLVRADDGAAVARLRACKQRPAKPLAVMAASLAAAEALATISPVEAALLASPAAPIVLLEGRPGAVAAEVAPGRRSLGLMLPATPLHHLLLGELDGPVVATSGNRSGEPLCSEEREAEARLGEVADLFLHHDRPIARPVDDSLARVIAGRPTVLRAARGLAPLTIDLAAAAPPTVSLGAHLKNAPALYAGGRALLGPHVGDLDDARVLAASRRSAAGLAALAGVAPAQAACDAHPDYGSTRLAESLGLPLVRVQHHLAHALALAAEHRLSGPLLAVVWDGTGAGPDGTVWGGELLVSPGDRTWRRAAHLARFRLPGGDAATRDAARAAVGLLAGLGAPDAPVPGLAPDERRVFLSLIARGVNAPFTSSAGRLFDGLAALLGLCRRQGYEAEAAARLEEAAAPGPAEPYPMPVLDGRLEWAPLVRAVLADRSAATPIGIIAARIHETLAAAITAAARALGHRRVLLCGGCFQNARLSERTRARLTAAGGEVFLAGRVPPNDGALALGQLVAAVEGHHLEGT